MALRPEDLPFDPALSELVLALIDKVDSLKGVLAALQRLIHGPRSEATMDVGQLVLDLADFAAVPAPANDDTATPSSHRPRSRKKRNIGRCRSTCRAVMWLSVLRRRTASHW